MLAMRPDLASRLARGQQLTRNDGIAEVGVGEIYRSFEVSKGNDRNRRIGDGAAPDLGNHLPPSSAVRMVEHEGTAPGRVDSMEPAVGVLSLPNTPKIACSFRGDPQFAVGLGFCS